MHLEGAMGHLDFISLSLEKLAPYFYANLELGRSPVIRDDLCRTLGFYIQRHTLFDPLFRHINYSLCDYFTAVTNGTQHTQYSGRTITYSTTRGSGLLSLINIESS